MNRRLIDAYALRDRFDRPECRTQTRRDFIAMLDYAPTIDAVEVIRCRECKLFMEYTEEYQKMVENADGDCSVRVWFSNDEQFCAVQYDDYCSLAKRKEAT